jgi:hypothetical protein
MNAAVSIFMAIRCAHAQSKKSATAWGYPAQLDRRHVSFEVKDARRPPAPIINFRALTTPN